MPGPLAVAGIAAGASLLGGALSNRANRKEAEKDRAFQERMSSSSYQRGVADMRAAGLNPALMYSSGKGGASTPGGAMARQDDVISGASSSAMAAMRLKQEIKNMKEQEQLIYNEALLKRQQSGESAARMQLVIDQQEAQETNNELLKLMLPWARAQSGAALKFPGAAMLQLIMNSGGSQAMSLTGGLGAARMLRGSRALRGPTERIPSFVPRSRTGGGN